MVDAGAYCVREERYPSASGAPREEELLGISGGRAEPLHKKSGCLFRNWGWK